MESDMYHHVQRADSGFSESPKKRGKRSIIHTPILQSFDTSPASMDAYKRQQQDPQTVGRQFIQGPIDGDIFGIRIPAACKLENRGRQATPTFDSSELNEDSKVLDSENDERDFCRSPEKKTPAWIRAGPPVPLGEMEMEDPRTSLGLDSTMDFSSSLNSDPFNSRDISQGDQQQSRRCSSGSSRQISREWPPSPKKSPVKRKLQFKQPTQTDPDMTDPFTNHDEPNHERSFLSSLQARQTLPELSRPAARETEEEVQDMTREFVRPQRRQRASILLRNRRRPTNVHEDPTSPRPDPATRVKKKSPPQSRSSSSGSERAVAGFISAVADEPLAINSRGLVDVQDTPNKAEVQRRSKLEDKLWAACGGDIARWNSGDFDARLGLGLGNVRW